MNEHHLKRNRNSTSKEKCLRKYSPLLLFRLLKPIPYEQVYIKCSKYVLNETLLHVPKYVKDFQHIGVVYFF